MEKEVEIVEDSGAESQAEDYIVHEVRLASRGYKTSCYVLLEFEDGRWKWHWTEFAETLDKVLPTLMYHDFAKWPVKSPHA